MTETLGAPRFLAWLALIVTGALLQGCAPPAPPGSRLRVYAADLAGAAKSCSAPRIMPTAGKATAVTFARQGAQVFCVDRNASAAASTVDIIVSEGGKAMSFAADASPAC